MKKYFPVSVLSILWATSALCGQESRMWRTSSGKSVDGTLIKVNGPVLEIATEDNKVVRVKSEDLGEKDQTWVKEHGEKAANKAVIPLKPSTHKLNLVYFLGNDREPVEGYEKRLSDLMLYAQQFYGKEMLRNGFGARSFGLDMKSPEEVNIIVYKAKGPATDYPYDNGGGYKASKEVNDYLDAKGLRQSEHTLIIFPTFYDEKNTDMTPGGVPFYGLGKTCCALDYKFFDIKHLGEDSEKGKLLTKWYGGMIHELGHGLNLPHNHATVTDQNNMGTALMGAGNYTFGLAPTFITPAHCAILDTCEIFSTDKKKKFYQAKNEVDMKPFVIDFKDDAIQIKGKFKANNKVKSVNVYIEEPPFGVNQDYEANNFTVKVDAKSKELKISIPWKEINAIKGNDVQIRLMFIFEDGGLVSKPFDFKKDDLKTFDIEKSVKEEKKK